MDDDEKFLEQVFGESSDSDAEEEESTCEDGCSSNLDPKPIWQEIAGINGLCLCRDFLSPQQQTSLLSAIQSGAFFAIVFYFRLDHHFGSVFLLNPSFSRGCRRMVH